VLFDGAMMEETLKSKPLHNIAKLPEQRYKDIAEFSRKIEASLGRLVFSIVVRSPSESSDSVEIVLLVDDFNSTVFNQQLSDIQLKASELAYSSTLPVKCSVVLASSFWDGFRGMDEGAMGLLRDGLVMHDRGFFLPLQDLLVTGKVRPSRESVKVYFVKAEQSMKSAGQRVHRAVLDLYWAVLDSAHAAVMMAGITPPSPKDLVGTVKRDLVARNLVHPRCAEVADRIYDVANRVMHREVFEISGRDFDSYLHDADFFIKEMDEFVKEHVKER
jgi:uncharacterized protein (UPF0332 family)